MAKKFAKAEVINFLVVNPGKALKQMIGGRSPDVSTPRLPHFSTTKGQLHQSCS